MQRILAVCLLVVALGLSWPGCAHTGSEAPPELGEVVERLEVLLGAVDTQLAAASKDLAWLDLSGAHAGAVLERLCLTAPLAIDCAAVDPRGVMVRMAPEAFRHLEGTDISVQSQVIRVRQSMQPVFSPLFATVEGVQAVDFQHPVLGGDKFLGSVSVILNPAYVAGLVIETLPGTEAWFWRVVQEDGVILYSTDLAEVGLDLAADGRLTYLPGAHALAEALPKSDEGTLSGRGRLAGTLPQGAWEQHWRTVSMAGAVWRVAAGRVE